MAENCKTQCGQIHDHEWYKGTMPLFNWKPQILPPKIYPQKMPGSLSIRDDFLMIATIIITFKWKSNTFVDSKAELWYFAARVFWDTIKAMFAGGRIRPHYLNIIGWADK